VSPKKTKQSDPLEQAIEAVLSLGDFISYNAAWPFVEDIQGVANDIEKIIDGEPERAARLFETFIAACHEKAEEIDDSSGNFGMLVDDLFRGWIKARQAANTDPDETAKLLLAWMEDDPYGFCHDLDREAVKVLDKKGLESFARQIRTRFDAALTKDDKDDRVPGYEKQRWGGALKNVLAAQNKIDAYVALSKETELGADDCKIVAEMYCSRKKFEDAFSWVERGLEIAGSGGRSSTSDYDLRGMKRELLAKLGRAGDALESAWSEFKQHPSTFSYKELMQYVPTEEKKAWHEKAMEASEKGDLHSLIELWLEQREIEQLATRLRITEDKELEDLSHYCTEPLARKIEHSHPDIAARVYKSLCLRIVNAGKSKYYDAALDNIEHAKKCYIRAGLDADWKTVVEEIREQHFRKKGFMAAFEEIVSDAPKKVEPTFLERAKQRWPKGSNA
jgi:hypothetical protein